MRVTIITPTYNRADYLEGVIESVLNQTYPDIEYIVLDDGSTDNTLEILERYTGRLYWESHPNMGEPRTVNKGFQMAKGEWVGIVNSDDPIHPELVAEVVAFIKKQPEAIVAYPDWHRIDGDSKVISEPYCREYNYLTMLKDVFCLVGPGAFIRRDILQKHLRSTSYKYVSDFEFWLRVGLEGTFLRVPKLLATHRVHAGSASVALRGKVIMEEHVRMYEEFFQRPDLPAQVQAVKNESLATVYYMAARECLPQDYATARQYFKTSLRSSPLYYLKHPMRLGYVLSLLLTPTPLHQPLYKWWMGRKTHRVIG